MASTVERKRPGRPRQHPTPKKLGIRFHPDLFTRLDEHLVNSEPETTQRAFIERAVERELDDPKPPEGDTDGDSTTSAGDPGGD
jgi:hypothetical protein